jgi:hypothetical protein
MACVCGHAKDEHGGDPEYPGSTACNAEIQEGDEYVPCACVAYEEDQGEE